MRADASHRLVQRLRPGMAAVLALSLVGCGWWFRDTGLVGLARTLSHSTTLAHRYLVAGFDATAAPEDAVDQALLAEVMELDEADEHLSRDIGRLQQLPPSDDHGALRAEILRSLDQIDADYASVMRTVQPRNVHTAVAEALAEVPATVRQIRARILGGE